MRVPRYVFTQYVPTRRLALAVALLSPLRLLGSGSRYALVPAVALAVLLFIAVIDALLIPERRAIEVARTLPPNVGVGDTTHGRYTVEHGVRRTVRVELFDAIPAAVESRTTQRSFRVRRAVPTDVELEVTGRVRGEHELGVVVLRVSGPLDLVRRSIRFQLGDRIVVMPSVAGARGLHLPALHRRTQIAGA